jgi:hypothetical protein
MPVNPEDFPVFPPLDKDVLRESLRKLYGYLGKFYKRYGIKPIPSQGDVLIEAIERIEKRRVYFHIFHDRLRMGELNEGALMCFWIIKLHPFCHQRIDTERLNAVIAVYVLASVVSHVARTRGKQVNLSQEIASSIFYAFRYRDISKEAIMLLAESLIP